MSGELLAFWGTVVSSVLAGVAWLIKRAAERATKAEDEQKAREEAEQARRITDRPEFQDIIAKQAESFMQRQAEQIQTLIDENRIQRQQHSDERAAWLEARNKERVIWETELNRREETIRSLRDRVQRLEQEVDSLKSDSTHAADVAENTAELHRNSEITQGNTDSTEMLRNEIRKGQV